MGPLGAATLGGMALQSNRAQLVFKYALPVLAVSIALGSIRWSVGAAGGDAFVARLTALPDVCDAAPAAGPVTSYELRYDTGFPEWNIRGSVGSDGRYAVEVRALPNGPGDGWTLRERGCLPREALARVLAALEGPRASEPYAPGGANSLPRHCVQRVLRDGRVSPLPVPAEACVRARGATEAAEALFQHLREPEREPECGADAQCVVEFASVAMGHHHHTYDHVGYRVRLHRDGRLSCLREADRLQRSVDPSGAASAIDAIADIVREGSSERRTGSFVSYEDVLVGASGSRLHAARDNPLYLRAVARWNALAASLPELCRVWPSGGPDRESLTAPGRSSP